MGKAASQPEPASASADQDRSKVPTAEVIELLRPMLAGFYQTFAESEDTRGVQLFDSATHFQPTWLALSEVRSGLLWWSRLAAHPEITALLVLAARKIETGVQSIVNERGPRVVDEARFLMEVEFLLHDFALDPARIDEWASLDAWARNQRYSFGQCRSRVEKARGIPARRVLPDRDEYSVHSAAVHPQPMRDYYEPIVDPDERRTMLYFDLGDLVMHAWRVLSAFLEHSEQFFAENADDFLNDEDNPEPDMSLAQRLLDFLRKEHAGAGVPPRPEHIDVASRSKRDESSAKRDSEASIDR